MRGRAWLPAMFALPLLSGCVAAAIPILAASGVAKTQIDKDDAPRDTRPRVALPADPPGAAQLGAASADPATADAQSAIVRDYTLIDGTQVTVTNSLQRTAVREPLTTDTAPAAAIAVPAPTPVPAPLEPATDGPKVTYLAGVTSLPAPVPGASAPRAVMPGAGYAAFTAFARAQAAIPVAGAERLSALLADSGRLSPETRACSIHPSAVMIDLDPAGDLLDTSRPLAGDPALAASLAQLRSEGVEIGWVSGRTADRAGAIRKALAGAGLDPEGRDQLILLRFPEERKQTRREDFAKANCVLAIAGDERADFDELFAYLRDPNAATPLDALIGQRWFLVPPPLN